MLFLASQSPRRRQLLAQIGVAFTPIDVAVAEQRAPHEAAVDYVHRVALDKARAGLAHPGPRAAGASALVLGADTEVVLDEEVFGKPADAVSAAAMLRRLSGRTHQVLSVVWCTDGQRERSAASRSEVRFAALDERSIAAYLDSGEWQGKAGGYAIQGRAAAFVAHLSGSYSGVMGLPLYETAGLLGQFAHEAKECR